MAAQQGLNARRMLRPATTSPLPTFQSTGGFGGVSRTLQNLTPVTPPFTWAEVEGGDTYRELQAPDQMHVKRAFFQQYQAPAGQTWEAFEDETDPGMAGRFVGAARGALGSLQESAALTVGALGYTGAEERLRKAARTNLNEAARTAFLSKYGESGWRQLRNLADIEWWKSVVAEMGPQSAPFLAGMGVGAAAGIPFGPLGILVGAIIGGGGAAAFQEMGGAYNEYLEKYPDDPDGATEYAWIKSGLSAILNGASVPLGLVGRSAIAPIKYMLVQMVIQGGMGTLDQSTQNLARRDLLDPKQPLSEGMARAFMGEAIFETGGVMAVARAARRRRIEDALNAEQVLGAELDEAGMPDAPNPEPPDQSEEAPAATGAAAPDPTTGAIAPEMPTPELAAEAELPVPPPLAEAPPPGPPSEQAPPVSEQPPGIDEQAHEAATSPSSDAPEPSEAQKRAGNYQKGHIRLHGLDITIENPAGSVRTGTNADGTPWEAVMGAHYGYVKRTEGADGDQVDVFIGPNPESERVWLIDQVDPETGAFDEHKVLLGFEREELARNAYLDSYEPGWQGLGAIREMTLSEFKDWLKSEETTAPAAPEGLLDGLEASLMEDLATDSAPKNNRQLRVKLGERLGKAPGEVTDMEMKRGQESFETAMANWLRGELHMGRLGSSDGDIFANLLRIYQDQPVLDFRTGTSVAGQAYSTPAPIAFLANRLAGITRETSVLEPTAGNGLLVLTGRPENTTAVELDPGRAESLRRQGFQTIEQDIQIFMAENPGLQVDRVIANPPFEKLPATIEVDGYKINKLDHQIAMAALGALRPDGRAVLILGANKEAGAVQMQDRPFLNWLYGRFNVIGHFEIDGDLYRRQGAAWPIRMITIAGRRVSEEGFPASTVPSRAMTWEEVYGLYEQTLSALPDEGMGAAERELAVPPIPRVGVERGPPEQPGGAPGEVAGPPGAEDLGRLGGREGLGAPKGGPRGPGPGELPGERVAGADLELGQRDVGPGRVGLEPGEPTAEPPEGIEPLAGPAEPGAGERPAEPAGEPVAEAAPPEVEVPKPPAIVPPSRPEPKAPIEALGEFQAPYQPRSQAGGDAVLAPVNMAPAMQRALDNLEDAVGPADAYLMDKLGYKSRKELGEALMDMQIDSVAAAIRQIERGRGFIIGDATGVGKGRQGAALIRYGVRNGMIPISFTEKAGLFSDGYRDLTGIGSGDLAPFIVNADAKIVDEEGVVRHRSERPAGRRRALRDMAFGKLPAGTDFVTITYSQVNRENLQRSALLGLAQRKPVLLILDESHNAAGDSKTGEFMRGLQAVTRGVTYLSATFAKRPDNMPLYSSTDMGQTSGDDNSLTAAFAEGGVALQTVVSNMLAEAGQMFRRERSFAGVSVNYQVNEASREQDERTADNFTDALRAIVDFDHVFDGLFIPPRREELQRTGTVVYEDGTRAAPTVKHANFTSIVHNLVRQFLFALKADQVADMAIAAVEAGEKPLIVVDNTMGSFLKNWVSQRGLRPGSPLGELTYRQVLERALVNQARYSVQHPDGTREIIRVNPIEFSADLRLAFERALQIVRALDVDLPVSPIDWICNRMKNAELSVAEITGRDLTVDYSGEEITLGERPKEELDRVTTVRKFNSRQLDVLILNQAGAGGISLHASRTFKDQRPRHMLIVQSAQDINIFMQMLGRIHRTGQVVTPKYTILVSDIPGEKRPGALLAQKLMSLNANTTSNTRSGVTREGLDFLNKYGNRTVRDYLAADPGLTGDLDVDLEEDFQDLARKATGRLALMPIETQQRFYDDVEASYQALIDFLNDTGQNDLEPRTMDYDARVLEQRVVVKGSGETGPFGQDAVYNVLDIKRQGKPPTPAEVQGELDKNLGEAGAAAYVQAFLAPLEEAASVVNLGTAAIDPGAVARVIRERMLPGYGYSLQIGEGETARGVIVGLKSAWRPGQTGNPLAPSKIQVQLMINRGSRRVTIPLSQWSDIVSSQAVRNPPIEDWFTTFAPERERARVLTGNLLAGYQALNEASGTIITYQMQDGAEQMGILLSNAFKLDENIRVAVALRSADEVAEYLEFIGDDPTGVYAPDISLRIRRVGRDYQLVVATARSLGGRWLSDERLQEVAGGDFAWKQGEKFAVADFADEAQLRAVVDHILTRTNLVASPAKQGVAETIVQRHRGEPPKESRARPRGRAAVDLPALRREATRIFGRNAPELRVVEALYSQETGQPISGQYARDVVTLAQWSNNPRGTFRHEILHHAMEVLMPEDRARVLEDLRPESRRNAEVVAQLRRRGDQEAAEHAAGDAEEAAAYMFELGMPPEGIAGRALQKLRRMLRRIHRWITGDGQRTVEDVFAELEAGRLRAAGAPGAAGQPRESRAAVRPGSEMPTSPRKIVDKLLNIPFRLIPVHKGYAWIADHVLDFVPERVRAGLYDRWGETDAMKGARLRYRQGIMESARTTRRWVERLGGLDRLESRVAYNWLTTNDAVEEARLMELLPEESRSALRELKEFVVELGHEAVRLGLITEDSRKRNEMAYLRRSYVVHELAENGSLPRHRTQAIKILGDNLKGRGMTQVYERQRLLEDTGPVWYQAHAKNLVGQKFLRLNRRARTGRLLKMAYVPVGLEIPEHLQEGWEVDSTTAGEPNVWEARWEGRTRDTIRMWRDFTAEERQDLGEIDEVQYAVARTLVGLLRDLETARYFEYLAGHPDWSVSDPGQIPEGHTIAKDATRRGAYLPTEWIQVPDSRIPQTPQVRKYGALAGKWVPGPIWNEIRTVADWSAFPRWKWFRDLVRAFKISKTALSPKTHVNNVMANIWFAEWADLRASSVVGALQVYFRAARGDKGAQDVLDDFRHSGAGYGTFAEQELRAEVLEPLEKALREELARRGIDHPDAHPLGGVRSFALVDGILNGLNAVKDKSIDLYQLEDNVFRLAMYRQARTEEGLTTQQAAARATDAFLDYDINAPWVNVARASFLPFIAFSYRAIPKLHQLAKEKPYKLLKMGLIMGALNAAAYAFIEADEEEERNLLPPERAGKVFGIFPRLMRWPWNIGGQPTFTDVVRWIPAGDLFLWRETNTAIPILPFLVPGGPVEWGVELLMNKDGFTGQEITKRTDTPWQKGKAVALHLWKGIVPNSVVIPYSYDYDRVFPSFPEPVQEGLRAVGLGSETPILDPFGREFPSWVGALNAFGIKIAVYPTDVARMRLIQRGDALIRDLELELHRSRRTHMRGGITLQAMKAKEREVVVKIKRIIDDRVARLTVTRKAG